MITDTGPLKTERKEERKKCKRDREREREKRVAEREKRKKKRVWETWNQEGEVQKN